MIENVNDNEAIVEEADNSYAVTVSEYKSFAEKYYTHLFFEDVLKPFLIEKDGKLLCNKEFAIFGMNMNMRCVFFYNATGLMANFKRWGGYDYPKNIYYSVANFKDMKTMFSFKLDERQAQKAKFALEYPQFMDGYDHIFDLDGKAELHKKVAVPNPDYEKDNKLFHELLKAGTDEFGRKLMEEKIREIYSPKKDIITLVAKTEEEYNKEFAEKQVLVVTETKRLKTYYDQYKVPYSVKCSGSGFHIRIRDKYRPNATDKVKSALVIAREIAHILNLRCLDTNIYDARRVWKLDYSLDIKSGNIALPLSDEQMKNFSWDMVNWHNCVPYELGRGTLERAGTKENYIKFCEEVLGIEFKEGWEQELYNKQELIIKKNKKKNLYTPKL